MQASGLRKTTVQAGLMYTVREMKELFFQSSFEDTVKNSKRMSKLLAYYVKYFKFSSQNGAETENLLKQCLRIVARFISSSQIQKFGQSFPFYTLLLKKSKNTIDFQNSTLNIECQQNILSRVSKNQASSIFKLIKKHQIKTEQLNFLKQEAPQNLIKLLESKEINFRNPQCVSCSSVFLKDLTIYNSNPVFSTLLCLNVLDTGLLIKLLNSIANQNGGVIIIGAKKIDNSLKPGGLKFETEQKLIQAHEIIIQLTSKIKPHCRSLVDILPVHKNFLLPHNVDSEEFRICFRVLIFPQAYGKISYLEFVSKNKSLYYQTYILDEDQNPVQVKSNQEKSSSIYTLMEEMYAKRNTYKVNSHQGILCYKPLECDLDKLKNSHPSKNNTNTLTLNLKKMGSHKSEQKEQYVPDDAPQFKYARTTIVILNTTKDDRQIINFYENLLERKFLVELFKPFPVTFPQRQGERSIWLLSHEMSFIELRKWLKYDQQEGNIKPVVRMMSVEHTLQIQQSKFLEASQKYLNKKFHERYSDEYIMESAEVTEKLKGQIKLIFLNFPDFEQAIYAYMVMEEMSLRPYFIRQGKFHGKK